MNQIYSAWGTGCCDCAQHDGILWMDAVAARRRTGRAGGARRGLAASPFLCQPCRGGARQESGTDRLYNNKIHFFLFPFSFFLSPIHFLDTLPFTHSGFDEILR
jgi:hypothetical protein